MSDCADGSEYPSAKGYKRTILNRPQFPEVSSDTANTARTNIATFPGDNIVSDAGDVHISVTTYRTSGQSWDVTSQILLILTHVPVVEKSHELICD